MRTYSSAPHWLTSLHRTGDSIFHRAARSLSSKSAALFRLLELAGQDGLETLQDCVRLAATLAHAFRSCGAVDGEGLQQPGQRDAKVLGFRPAQGELNIGVLS